MQIVGVASADEDADSVDTPNRQLPVKLFPMIQGDTVFTAEFGNPTGNFRK
jgi:hypothetical protein